MGFINVYLLSKKLKQKSSWTHVISPRLKSRMTSCSRAEFWSLSLNSPWPPSYFCNFFEQIVCNVNNNLLLAHFDFSIHFSSGTHLHLLQILRMWAFQLFHFSGSRVQFSRQVGLGGIYRYLGDIWDITERGRPHLQSLTVTSLKSSGSWGLYLPFSLNFLFSLYFP